MCVAQMPGAQMCNWPNTVTDPNFNYSWSLQKITSPPPGYPGGVGVLFCKDLGQLEFGYNSVPNGCGDPNVNLPQLSVAQSPYVQKFRSKGVWPNCEYSPIVSQPQNPC